RGQVVLVVSADDPPVYAYDPTQPDSRAARLAVDAALQRAAGRADAFTPGRAEQTEPGTRYVAFLVPGLLGMNLMGTGLWRSGLGLLAGARPRTVEGASGLMNLVMVPMWIFSGIFFSTERFPHAMQPFVQALPLTALNNALRAVMLEGAGLAPLLPGLALLAAWGAISFVV